MLWPLMMCSALLVVRMDNIDFLQTSESYLSHLHLLCVVKAPPWQSSSMGREMLIAAALSKRKKTRFGRCTWLSLLSLVPENHCCAGKLRWVLRLLLVEGKQVESGRILSHGAAAGRCRCFIYTQLEEWKTKISFFGNIFFPLTENRNICISFCPEMSLYIFSSTLKCINLKSQKKGCGSVEIKTSSPKNLLMF